jgi:putative autoinducer-2 (AI-2) aldolase
MVFGAVPGGASAVDTGRNIFQSDAPVAMIQAVRSVVHQDRDPEQALDVHQTLERPLDGWCPFLAVETQS